MDLATIFKIECLISRIAKRGYPLVFVVEEDTEAERFIDRMVHDDPPERWREIAREEGIPALDGRYVVENFRGEMAPEAEEILEEEVMHISAARQRMVVVDTGDLIPVKELTRQDVDQWWFEYREALTKEVSVPFVIPPTDRVKAYLKENGN